MAKSYPILALDVGDQRVGVAILSSTDSACIPLQTHERARGQAEKAIIELLASHQVQTLVIGLPLSDEGLETEQSEKVRNFARRLARRTTVEICFVDEYASSAEAREMLGLNSEQKQILARKKGMIDAVSASIILQRYISEKQER